MIEVFGRAGDLRIRHPKGELFSSAASPDDLRKQSDKLRNRPNKEKRHDEWAALMSEAADIWKRQQAESAAKTKAHARAKRAHTQRDKDKFTAAYGVGDTRKRGQKRLEREA